jgi:hypothetical protein
VNEIPENHYLVIHPLDDVTEEKVDISALGPMTMTSSVRLSLMALRGYLILMMLMVIYHVMDLAGMMHFERK